MLPDQALGVKGQVILHTLLGQNGRAGGHAAHHGHLVLFGLALVGDGDGAGLARGLGDQPGALQSFQVKMDGGRGFQAHILADLPDGRGIAVLIGEGDDIIVDLLLFCGKLFHG